MAIVARRRRFARFGLSGITDDQYAAWVDQQLAAGVLLGSRDYWLNLPADSPVRAQAAQQIESPGPVSNQHMPGEEWVMGPGQGCAPGYVEQQLANGHWTCIPEADFQKIQAGDYTPLNQLPVASTYQQPGTLYLPTGETVQTKPATPPPPPPPSSGGGYDPAHPLKDTPFDPARYQTPTLDLAGANQGSAGSPVLPSGGLPAPAEAGGGLFGGLSLSSPVVLGGLVLLAALALSGRRRRS
jgi:hypothetical protein